MLITTGRDGTLRGWGGDYEQEALWNAAKTIPAPKKLRDKLRLLVVAGPWAKKGSSGGPSQRPPKTIPVYPDPTAQCGPQQYQAMQGVWREAANQ